MNGRRMTAVSKLMRSELSRNSVFIMGATLVNSLLGGAFWITAARLYRTEAVGLAAALVSALMLTTALSMFGMQATLVDRLPRRESGGDKSITLAAAVLGAGGLSCIGAVAVAIVLPHLSDRFEVISGNAAYLAAFVSGCVLTTIASVLDYVFVAEQSAGKMAIRNAVSAAAKLPLVMVAAAFGTASALAIVGSWSVAAALGVIAAIALLSRLRRGYGPAFAGTVQELRAMVPSLPLQHVISIAGGLSPFLLSLLVAARLSASANAHFYTTWMVAGLFFVVSPAVSWSLFAEGRRAGTELVATVRRAALVTACLLGPMMLVFLLLGRSVLLMFGPDYAARGHVLLTILVVSAIPDAVTNLYVGVMRVRGRLGAAAALNVAMLATTLGLAAALLPSLGIAGAGWAWLAAQSAGAAFVAAHLLVLRARASLGPAPVGR